MASSLHLCWDHYTRRWYLFYLYCCLNKVNLFKMIRGIREARFVLVAKNRSYLSNRDAIYIPLVEFAPRLCVSPECSIFYLHRKYKVINEHVLCPWSWKSMKYFFPVCPSVYHNFNIVSYLLKQIIMFWYMFE